MGAGKSKQIAEQVIAVCQQVNDDDQIDEILLEDRTVGCSSIIRILWLILLF